MSTETDLATRLAAALDRAEAFARETAPGFTEALDIMATMSGGHDDIAGFASDWGPDAVLRLIERDRALVALYRDTVPNPAAGMDAIALVVRQVEQAVAFWDGVHSGT